MDYLALSDDHTFLVSGFDGDLPDGDGRLGLYYDDTRHLSALELRVNGEPLSLLSSSDEDAWRTTILLTNPSLRDGEARIPPGRVGVVRSRVVAGGVYETVTLTNYGHDALTLRLSLRIGADFADLFQVRGFRLPLAGSMRPPARDEAGVLLAYEGGDGVLRATRLGYDTPPEAVAFEDAPPPDARGPEGEDAAEPFLPRPVYARLAWTLHVPPGGEQRLELRYTPYTGEPDAEAESERTHDAELSRQAYSYQRWAEESTRVETDNPTFDRLLARSARDLRALTAAYPTGRLPVAGIPWYAVPFGRDSLITCLQALCFRPELAEGCLRFLAAHQAAEDDPWRDAEPGKVLHEMRFGELAGTRKVPHTPYYGSVDSTPLFVMLFARTVAWTGDRALYAELLPHVRRALEWIDTHGDLDGDGYLEYRTRSEGGIVNQGWKDSGDSLLRPDGSSVEPPVALVEVQAYAHAAKAWLAPVAERMGDAELGTRLRAEAAALAERFDRDYWLEAEGCYAQALDARKRPVPDVTSNAGHALACGIVPPERAARLAARLLRPDMASGWGLRTRASSDANYNPMSYHNGSVWPHDNSLVAYGLALAGERQAANAVAGQLLAAAGHFRLSRLPELYCGFGPDETTLGRPADYPVSCSPQAWAAGTPYLLLQSILGLEADALGGTLTVRPHLPPWLGRVELSNLRVGEGRVHLVATPEGTTVVEADGVDVRVDP